MFWHVSEETVRLPNLIIILQFTNEAFINLKCLFVFLALRSEIINGKKTKLKSMQYMASVQNKHGYHICGGFLISEDFVLTAAHCIRSWVTFHPLAIFDLWLEISQF